MLRKSRNIRIVQAYGLTRFLKIKQDDQGLTVHQLLCKRFPFKTPDYWLRVIDAGRVRLSGHPLLADTPVLFNQKLENYNPQVIEPTVPDEIRIIDESEDWLVVYKPAPMPMHPGGRYNKNSLLHILKDEGYDSLHIVHRLDAVTSGLVIFAKNQKMARLFTEEFTQNRVQKAYYALCEGVTEKKNFEVNLPIRRKKGFVFECGLGLENAKDACTLFKVVDQIDDEYTLVHCTPKTGRTHQIRLHLASANLPIVDDVVYQTKSPDPYKEIQNREICLQSSLLHFEKLDLKFELEIPQIWYHINHPTHNYSFY